VSSAQSCEHPTHFRDYPESRVDEIDGETLKPICSAFSIALPDHIPTSLGTPTNPVIASESSWVFVCCVLHILDIDIYRLRVVSSHMSLISICECLNLLTEDLASGKQSEEWKDEQ
jgi:hypothetical protein